MLEVHITSTKTSLYEAFTFNVTIEACWGIQEDYIIETHDDIAYFIGDERLILPIVSALNGP